MKSDQLDTYVIPPNFIEGGTLMGGMFKTRNAIEAGILGLAVGVPVFHINASLTARIIILCLTALPLMLFAEPLLSLFNRQPEVLHYGRLFVLWISPFYLFACVNDILGGALRGAGEATPAMICMLSSFVVIRQIYLFIGSRIAYNPYVIGFGYPVGWMTCCVAEVTYFMVRWNKKSSPA